MKKIFWGIILLLVLAVFTAPRILWEREITRPLSTLIVDKTVPDQSYREHAGLIWTLNHLKIQAPQNTWNKATDYFGFTPPPAGEKPPLEGPPLTSHDLENKEWLVLADSYGVYHQDFHLALQESQNTELESPDYSKKIYGGFDKDEVSVIENFVKQGGHLWAEFNTFASPTHGEPRERLEKVLGLDWTGWAGRFFEQLENKEEVPAWARRNWKQHHGTDWAFKGAGWLLVHEDGRIEVLQEGPDIEKNGLKIYLQSEDPLLNHCYDRVPFHYWFDILTPTEGQVLAQYKLELKDPGREILKKAGIPENFPALIKASNKPLVLYFAGDASDAALKYGNQKLKGRMYWKRFGRLQESTREQGAYFWEFYLPLMQNITNRLAPLSE